MSERAYVSGVVDGAFTWTWSGLGTGDTGVKLAAAGHSDKTVTISGTATTFALKGANRDDFIDAFTVSDIFTGTAITAAGAYVIKENPAYLWPDLTTGSSVIVKIVAP